jgi:hypothetical protein
VSLEKAKVAAMVLRAMLTRLQLKWTMASIIKVDDNHSYKPGVDVPMYHISGVELRQSRYEAAQYKKIWDIFSPYLNRAGDGTGKPSNKPSIVTAGSTDMALHRSMSISAFDMQFHTLLLRMVQHGASEAALWLDADDHGFSDYFAATRPTLTLPNYLDRVSVCAYIASESVKIRYAAKHVSWALYGDEHGNYKGKVTRPANWPHTQWDLDCFVFNLRVPYYATWSEPNASPYWMKPDDETDSAGYTKFLKSSRVPRRMDLHALL